MILETIVVGEMEANCYIFGSDEEREVVLIDPGADYEKLSAFIKNRRFLPKFIVNTHGHIDHIGANHRFNLPILIHRLDADFLSDPQLNLSALSGRGYRSPRAARLLEEGDSIEVGDIELKVIHTPGHTPGGISLRYEDLIFTGDTLFKGGVGRTDLPYGSEEQLLSSIKEKLLTYDDQTIIYPGHGPISTIAKERRENPYL